MSISEFLSDNGCPKCKSKNISYQDEFFSIDDRYIDCVLKCKCKDCSHDFKFYGLLKYNIERYSVH